MNPIHYRKEFPILDNPLIYFDSASTSLKPQSVIDAFCDYYKNYTSNIHRSTHIFAERAMIAFEGVRESVASFIKADKNQIIFTHNCSDAINLVSELLAIKKEDEIICSILEHHSNYLPWRTKSNVIVVNVTADGLIDLDEIERSITKKTKLIAMTYVSNVTGNIQPVHEIVELAKKYNILTLIDAAQAVGHFAIDVTKLNCDFLVFSAHKMLGPSGIGILYCSNELLNKLPPSRVGGGMINQISKEELQYKKAPYCFEVGTPNIENVIAFGKAIDFFNVHGFNEISHYLEELNLYFIKKLAKVDSVHVPFSIHHNHIPIFTLMPKNNSVDLKYLGRMLSDTYLIALNVGVQCCQPLYQKQNIPAAMRVSLYLYNTKNEIDVFFDALEDLNFLLKSPTKSHDTLVRI